MKTFISGLMIWLAGFGLGSLHYGLSPAARTTPVPTPPGAPDSYQEINGFNGGTIHGRVKVSGPLPKLEPRKVTKNQDTCGHSKPPNSLDTTPSGGVKNAIVSIIAIPKGKARETGRRAVLDQRKCDYVPHVQVVPVGTTLEIRNSDPILHNVHAYLEGKETLFNYGMPVQGQKFTFKLSRPGLVNLKCDAGHTWMSGYIRVTDHPYYALTDTTGKFSLTAVPPGHYRLKVWHERLGTQEADVTVAEGQAVTVDFNFPAL